MNLPYFDLNSNKFLKNNDFYEIIGNVNTEGIFHNKSFFGTFKI